jgi:hypothetical protein
VRYYFKCIGLAIGIQLLVWILLYGIGVALTPSPAMDRIIEGFVRIYLPLVKLVGRLGNFKGDQNILMPILLGVPLGTVIYGVFFGVVIGYLKRVNEPARNTLPPG